MSAYPMRDAAISDKSNCNCIAPERQRALDRMDRWAGQVAAALMGQDADGWRRTEIVAADTELSQPTIVAAVSYDIAETLERERTRRMKG